MRHHPSRILLAASVALVSCAEAGAPATGSTGPWTPADGIPTKVELTCRSDGTMSVSSEQVQAQPDGVHLRVLNEYDEPVSVGGFDANPGPSSWTFGVAPGPFALSCWPFSRHTSGEEPERVGVEVLDPSRMYVDGEVDCDEAMSIHGDFAEEARDDGPPPLDVARQAIEGLRDDDVVRVAGYPDQDDASVVVVRDGDVIASFGFARFEGRGWSIGGATVCTDSGLDVFDGGA